jgi:hypothetical protein
LYIFHIKTSQVEKTRHLYSNICIFVSFLHFETHRFSMDILFYNFCMNFNEISWYYNFLMQDVLCLLNELEQHGLLSVSNINIMNFMKNWSGNLLDTCWISWFWVLFNPKFTKSPHGKRDIKYFIMDNIYNIKYFNNGFGCILALHPFLTKMGTIGRL